MSLEQQILTLAKAWLVMSEWSGADESTGSRLKLCALELLLVARARAASGQYPGVAGKLPGNLKREGGERGERGVLERIDRLLPRGCVCDLKHIMAIGRNTSDASIHRLNEAAGRAISEYGRRDKAGVAHDHDVVVEPRLVAGAGAVGPNAAGLKPQQDVAHQAKVARVGSIFGGSHRASSQPASGAGRKPRSGAVQPFIPQSEILIPQS